MRIFLSLFMMFGLILSSTAHAIKAGEPLEFKDADQEELYNKMLYELRCTVCQNESIAGSRAELANDLRANLYRMITEEGADQGQIKKFMVDRYGEFVLYRPTFSPANYLLWAGPFALLVLGVIILLINVRSRNKINNKSNLTAEEADLLAGYLDSKKEKE